jgi:hypothetical protein
MSEKYLFIRPNRVKKNAVVFSVPLYASWETGAGKTTKGLVR